MSEQNPAEILRRAATLMRERAEAASPGPWHQLCLGSEGCQVLNEGHLSECRPVSFSGRKEWKADHADAEYIAGMHPLVALAVADWLDEVAADRHAELPGWVDAAALAVARAYLGEAAQSAGTE